MGAPIYLRDLPTEQPSLALDVVRRADGRCEVGARGCDPLRAGIGVMLVDSDLPIEPGTVLHACRPCRDRCVSDPSLARRLAGVPA